MTLRLARLETFPELPGTRPGWESGGARPRFRLAGGVAVRLGRDLTAELERPSALRRDATLLTASDDLSIVVAAGRSAAWVERPDGVLTLPIPGVDSAAFPAARTDRLLLTVADPDGGPHEVLLIDPTAGNDTAARIDRLTVDTEDATAFSLVHPADGSVLIEFAMGQDGSALLRVDVVNDRLTAEELFPGEDPVTACFCEDGSRLLLVPHPTDPETTRVVSWPGLATIGSLDAAEAGVDMGWGLSATMLPDGRVLLIAQGEGLVATGPALEDPQRIDIPWLDEDGEVEWVCALDERRLALGVWTPQDRRIDVCRVSEGPP
ncbi:hypothetical protein [Propionicicella superfundia]|uniref:hypothetical protein n=1 Tax=Propionicicella superfundia TaxID=348582 RepID=UPI0004051B59|nr:hypothetical protein [Propionicicella superfundia]